jgi:hypothetical protein
MTPSMAHLRRPPSSAVGIVVNSIEGVTRVGDERGIAGRGQQMIAKGPLQIKLLGAGCSILRIL